MTKSEMIREMARRAGAGAFHSECNRVNEQAYSDALLEVTDSGDSPLALRALGVVVSWFRVDTVSRTMLYLDIMEAYHYPFVGTNSAQITNTPEET